MPTCKPFIPKQDLSLQSVLLLCLVRTVTTIYCRCRCRRRNEKASKRKKTNDKNVEMLVCLSVVVVLRLCRVLSIFSWCCCVFVFGAGTVTLDVTICPSIHPSVRHVPSPLLQKSSRVGVYSIDWNHFATLEHDLKSFFLLPNVHPVIRHAANSMTVTVIMMIRHGRTNETSTKTARPKNCDVPSAHDHDYLLFDVDRLTTTLQFHSTYEII